MNVDAGYSFVLRGYVVAASANVSSAAIQLNSWFGSFVVIVRLTKEEQHLVVSVKEK